jgi:predicted transcriptional regulator
LELKNIPRKDWRTHIKEFQLLKQKLEEYILKDYYNSEIPKEWLDARKKQRVKTTNISVRANKLEGEVSCKIATNLLRDVYGKNCKFEPLVLKLNEVYKNPGLYIYEEYENRDKLDKLFLVTSKNNIELITFSKKEFQIIETLNIHNLMSYNKFMEGNNAPFRRIVTANLISQLTSKNNNLFNNSYKFAGLSTEFQQILDELNDYRRKNINQYLSSEVLDAMYSVAKEHNLFDYSIYDKYVKMNDLLEKNFVYGNNS